MYATLVSSLMEMSFVCVRGIVYSTELHPPVIVSLEIAKKKKCWVFVVLVVIKVILWLSSVHYKVNKVPLNELVFTKLL